MKFSNYVSVTVFSIFSVASCIENDTKPFFDANGTKPIHYGILLFPGFQALDVFGPLDVLNGLSLLYPFPMRLTVLANVLSPVSTHVKTQMNHTMGNALTDFDQQLVVERTFAEQLALQALPDIQAPVTDPNVNATTPSEKIDVLIVPGGAGTRQDMTAEIAFVREMYPSLKSIMSICTGATILSRAGILDNKRATTNKRAWKWATGTGPAVNWVGEARWVVDGNIVTSSGVSAGMDATYAFVGLNYGKEVEENLANSAEYVRWVDAAYDPFAHVWNVTEPFNGTAPVVGKC
ncbi:class I glutamine amidotransferase-like protein [Aaosphaeria arxii CBS 175.79]|uniref:Class I glutamine amidotransferase-like protein n=1 Tax=Aaosphaeria arxii CBS 175.79 TaxID=1450172 RepID=A0A6A5XM30_9PLEO|nr:class I glutamine amidotransferase-like protein [Aaosphaeria arxii CBS 175.79]KAF2014308.1 class I glutamine amidotransferase-like protein [Aaosphaeria arxii CBS 175.79]